MTKIMIRCTSPGCDFACFKPDEYTTTDINYAHNYFVTSKDHERKTTVLANHETESSLATEDELMSLTEMPKEQCEIGRAMTLAARGQRDFDKGVTLRRLESLAEFYRDNPEIRSEIFRGAG